MSMFCYQCQETAGGKGCTIRGVCGKSEEVAKLQDLLIYTPIVSSRENLSWKKLPLSVHFHQKTRISVR